MAKSLFSLLVIVFCFSVFPGVAETTIPDSSGLRLSASGGASFPLGASTEDFGPGFIADLMGSYRLKNRLSFDFVAGYSRLPLIAGPSVETGRAELGLGIALPLGRSFAIEGALLGGGYYGMLLNSLVADAGGGASASASLFFQYHPTKNLELRLGARYRYLFGLWNGVEGLFAATLRLEPAARKAAPASPLRLVPLSSGALSLDAIDFHDIFPVFFKYYNENPLGSVRFTNTGKETITDLAVSFYAKQYMDAPKLCAKIPSVAPGEQVPIELVALFTDRILEVTEGTMISAEIAYSYTESGQAVTASGNEALRILDRNAMSWFDDRCAAAFVTAKDPAILGFSKNLVSSIKGDMNPVVNKNLQMALAIHDALDLYGLNYTVDPKSAYASTKGKDQVDFLQFPRQTLEYKAGDCDDLSILFAALLESVGIETAFVTVPGHIFAAFSLDTTPEEARKLYSRPDEFIMRDEKAWVPVEITDRSGGFLAAWQTGAKEWRENLARQQSGFFPIHEAWTAFEPVQLPGTSLSVAPPSGEAFISKFRDELLIFVDREIFPMAAKLKAEVERSLASPKSLNALGVLYAKYGLYDKAEVEFSKAIETTEYVPALLNLGNIYYLGKKMDKAEVCYERAYKIEPQNPYVVLSFARLNHDAENYGLVKKLYEELKVLSAPLAVQFAYLDLKGEEAARAADITKAKEIMVWLDEDE